MEARVGIQAAVALVRSIEYPSIFTSRRFLPTRAKMFLFQSVSESDLRNRGPEGRERSMSCVFEFNLHIDASGALTSTHT